MEAFSALLTAAPASWPVKLDVQGGVEGDEEGGGVRREGRMGREEEESRGEQEGD